MFLILVQTLTKIQTHTPIFERLKTTNFSVLRRNERCAAADIRCLLCALFRYLKRWISGGGTLVINVCCVQEISAILPMQRHIHVYLSFYFFFLLTMFPIHSSPETLPLVGIHAEVGALICRQIPHQSARSGNQI